MNNQALRIAAAALAATTLVIGATSANAADYPVPASPVAAAPDIWHQDTLTGDWGGVRSALKDRGLEFTFNYINELLGDVSGGLHRGADYEGRFEFSTDADLEKLIGMTGAKAHVTIYQIHNINGRIGPDFVGSIGDPSNIDAYPTTRLFTAWFEQSLFGDKVSVRLGQLAADDEFFTSTTAAGLIGGTFGWANYFAANLPSGGPAYPLAAPGLRLNWKPTGNISILAAAFSGDPAGNHCIGDPQVCNRHGTTFSFSGGVFTLVELQYNANQGKDAKGFAASYKLGGWYHSGTFSDQQYGVTANGTLVSLASPAAVQPLRHHGNGGIYGIVDQMVWRAGPQSASLFLRAGATSSDENLIPFYIDGGVGIRAPLPGRNDDVLTIGVAYSNISHDAANLDRNIQAMLGSYYPIRDDELQFEVSYQLQVAPWWTIQPDIQYIAHPGGHVPDPSAALNAPIQNALVLGVRSTMKF